MRLGKCSAFVIATALSFGALAAQASNQFVGTLAQLGQSHVDNQLQIEQIHVDRVTQDTPEGSIHQTLNCWQVTHGSWNGETLDGLSLVLIKQSGDANNSDRCIYVSDTATPAQRDALVAAISAANPASFPDVKNIRIEPASIEIQQLDGTTLILHVARIA